jgi:integrase
MASIVTDRKNGRRSIQFQGLDGKRRTIRLGKCSAATAATIKTHIEHILAAAAAGDAVPIKTAEFLRSISDPLHAKLAAVGLVHPRHDNKASVPTVGEFLDAYLGRRVDVKPATKAFYGHTARNLREFFGPNRMIGDISNAEGGDFRRWLIAHEKLSPATVARRCSMARTFFRDALRRKLINDNPFDGIGGGPKNNPARQAYIDRDTIQRILDAAPSAEWRLLIALARHIGLRVPSEAFNLKWSDIDWERGRLRVPSPKTAHHGKPFRVVPILPEVRPHLEDVFAIAPEGAEYVLQRLIERYSRAKTDAPRANFRTMFGRILCRAGVEPWPKLFHNLRASAATDFAQRFPAHVCSAWLGHTPAIAEAHYLMTTEEHFRAALEPPCSALQNPTQLSAARSDFEAHRETGHQKNPYFLGVSERQEGDTGLEPVRNAKRKTASAGSRAAKSDANPPRLVADVGDPRLDLLLRLWDRLDWSGRQRLLEAAQDIAAGEQG